ncbi:MAG: PH domain-containing protein [Lachnospiraceae bacterium]|nr:PH domain-containing protein [Lachnospiraceae bacterium]
MAVDFTNKTIFKLKKTNPESIMSDISPLLVSGENIIGVYSSIRDYVVFTDKRIISVNVQGITGKKKDFSTLPYSKIQVFSVETAGNFDLDSELEMYFSGLGKVKFEFSGNSDIVKIGQLISGYILK